MLLHNKESGSNSCVVLYYNSYNELRVILVHASDIIEAEDICLARGIKPVGIRIARKIIGDYEKWKTREMKKR